MTSRSHSMRAGFVGTEYPAFFVHLAPCKAPLAQLLYLPPFGEEMNRCRAIVAEQARWYADKGYSCTLLDFYGTGESRGELGDASLAIWRENIADACTSLLARYPVPLYLWGCRLGATLAADYLASSRIDVAGLLLWQPVVDGKLFLTQLLRQRTAALIDRGRAGESTAEMRARLAAGDSLEVAGYELSPRLVGEIDTLDLASAGGLSDITVHWLEHSTAGSTEPSPRSAKVMEQLRQKGCRIHFASFSGQPLWQLHERDSCQPLLDATRGIRL